MSREGIEHDGGETLFDDVELQAHPILPQDPESLEEEEPKMTNRTRIRVEWHERHNAPWCSIDNPAIWEGDPDYD